MDNQSMFQIVDGVHVPSVFDVETIRSAMNYKAQPNDIFIVTFPKSGTTWMETIVFGLLNNGQAFDDDINYYLAQTSFLERCGENAIAKMIRPGSIKTHLPFDRIPYHSEAKYICIVRDPKDICTSYYRFLSDHPISPCFNTTFDTFFEIFMNGHTPYGDYFKYISTLWTHKDDNNVLFVLYNQMKSDLIGVVRQVAQFLEISLNEELVERIVTHSSFQYMKERYDKKRSTFFAQQQSNAKPIDHSMTFIRKGTVGDWKSTMNDDQAQHIDKILAEMARDMPGIDTLWPSSYPQGKIQMTNN